MLDGVRNPFPGLRAFEPEEDYLFFGREKQIDDLLSLLRRKRFLAVVGSSGSGKSSLVRAGLIPALYGDAMSRAGSHWRVAVFRPGEDPLGRMARSLNACMDEEPFAETGQAIIEATLRRSSLGLAEAFRLARLPANDHLLLVVDQFEELFRYKASLNSACADDAVAFTKLLLKATQEAELKLFVVLTLRSDYIGSCAEFPGLAAAVSAGQYLVPRMTRAEMREAVIGPIRVGGAHIASRLTVRLLNEAGEDPEQLPVLQHSLMRTWDRWQRDPRSSEVLDFPQYDAIGTMSKALSQHADEAYAGLATDAQRTIAEKLFKALIDTDETGRAVRRPATLRAISAVIGAPEADVKAVIEQFRGPGRAFLAPPVSISLESSTTVDLSHESLMRVWGRLILWVSEERESAEFYRRLSQSAVRHQQAEQSLWRNPELSIGLRWLEKNRPTAAWAARYNPDFLKALAFLDGSRRAENKRRNIRIAALSVIVFAALAATGLYALAQKTENQRLIVVNQQLSRANGQLTHVIKNLRTEITNLQRRLADAERAVPAALPATLPPVELPIPPVFNKPKVVTPKVTEPQIPPPPPKLTPFAIEMLNAHNTIRARLGIPPLVWSDVLADRADEWAQHLIDTNQFTRRDLGQNTADSGPPGFKTGSEIVAAWAAEAANYNYANASCPAGVMCYHYTQVVWRDSKYLGCATEKDARRDVWVCNYDPPGNELGRRPY